jgi:catechol 2,3-dioxygenase-like lactoylglutathione lyase family enzyme
VPDASPAAAGLGRASPIFPVRDLAAAEAFYELLGFRTRRHDDGYGYAERDELRLHLRLSPELDPFANPTSVYVDTADPDALHAEWLPHGLWLVQVITPELAAEARRRWSRGKPEGRMNPHVEDKPWGVREFALLDLDNNQLRFGRPV